MNAAPSIQFYPTLRCNADCHFCFNRGLPAADDVTIDDFRKMVAILKDAGVRCIDILGGEPTLHPELLTLLDIIKASQMKSNLSTNGINVPLLNVLSERYDSKFLRIGISLNSREVSTDLHEYIVTHRPVLKSVATAQAAIPKSGEPYLHLPGIEYFLLYMDAANDKDLQDALPFYRFIKELTKLKKVHQGLDGVFCSGFIPRSGDDPSLKSVRCPAGTTKLSISVDGSVYPCYLFFRHEEFKLGNILTDNFGKIWQNSLLDYFRTFRGNTCRERNCPFAADCHGGCPAVSYTLQGSCDAPDPRCREHPPGL